MNLGANILRISRPFQDFLRAGRRRASGAAALVVLAACLVAVALDWHARERQLRAMLDQQVQQHAEDIFERVRRDSRETLSVLKALGIAASHGRSGQAAGFAALVDDIGRVGLALPVRSLSYVVWNDDLNLALPMTRELPRGGEEGVLSAAERDRLLKAAALQALKARRAAIVGPQRLSASGRMLAFAAPDGQGGAAVALVDLDAWMAAVMRQHAGWVRLRIVDAAASEAAEPVYGEHAAFPAGQPLYKHLFADTTASWRIEVAAGPDAQRRLADSAWMRTTLGVLASVLLATLVGFLSGRRRWAEGRAEEAVDAQRLSQARLERALAVTEDGIWEYDIAARNLYCSDRLLALLDLPARPGFRRLMSCVDATQRRRLVVAIRGALGTASPIDEQLHVRRPDGEERWLRLRARVTQSSSGIPVLVSGALTDVSEQVENARVAQQHHAFLQRVLDALPVPVAVKNAAYQMVAVNVAYCRSVKRDVTSLIGRRVWDLVSPESARRLEAMDAAALATGERQVLTDWIERSHDEPAFVRASKTPCRDATEQMVVVSCYENLTELRRREERETGMRAFLQTVFDALPHPLFVKDENHRYVMTNRAHGQLLGRLPEEVIGKRAGDFLPAELAREVEAAERDIFASGRLDNWEEEYPLVDGAGRTRIIVVRKTLCRNPDGAAVLIGINTDITSLRDVERDLRGTLTRYAALVDQSPLGIALLGPNAHFVMANPALCALVGYTQQELQARSFRDITPTRYRDVDDAMYRQMLAEGLCGPFEKHYLRKDGREVAVLVSGVRLLEEDGQIRNWALVQDLTAREQTEEALRRSEARWAFALEGAGDGVWDWDPRDNRCDYAPRWRSLLGHAEVAGAGDGNESENESESGSGSEIIAPHIDAWLSRIHSDDQTHVEAALQAHLRGHSPVFVSEHRLRCRDGHYKWFLARGKIVELDSAGRASRFIGTHADIDETRAVHDELRRNRDQLAAISRLLAQYMRTPQTRAAFEGLLDSLLDFTGSEYGFIGEVHYDGDQPWLKTHAISNIAWSEETRRLYALNVEDGLEFRRADTLLGKVMTSRALVIANDPPHDPRRGGTPRGHPPLRSFLGIPILHGDQLVGMAGLANRSGGYDESVAASLEPLLAGYATMIVAHRAEHRRLAAEEALTGHRDRLQELVADQTAGLLHAKDAAERASEAKSVFLANMSHELRTPMHAILSFARLGENRGEAIAHAAHGEGGTSGGGTTEGGIDKLRDYFSRIRSSGERLMDLLNNVLDLSKLEAGHMPVELRALDLRRVVDEVLHEYEAWLAAKQLAVEVEAQDYPPAHADAARMGQVLRNLFSNAIKFSPDGGRIHVALVASVLPAGRRAGDSGDVPAVELRVSDRGPGVPEAELASIFEKFVQSSATRDGSGGTGLGLAICREIVLAHRGHIFARNRVGGGAEFVVRIPAEAQQTHAAHTGERG
ncbi:PAS domain S-box protein [Uliginosibacterium sp. H1]|uniref:PAS domain S-box protein n=1 Tax=Uliginosibacterium sp. H1 TaxID=3114757 RepID=UPI002E19771E|nr:PAS domain S-box protein [Uliginosibacterium sp. H1]